ncbi:UDP-3-O-(3-hydroxymyristoyl) glucosamine N-acyltransferase [Synechococcus sp. PCC 7502]|uniref:UDP-3-O-(3-hydroxymyristoyl)glucosamine N-acyltransferase n=1 Tax=Synechococcus sp. PCC 7502 TaxID=1173263 RepID=UPI00029FCD48|nr:UDP-3-O-(3-hydroxymyristoyl)glucosamine N-acyltransferase [Synechococcus sp. PCC 7502]AFY73930.1 UDP-3-O-(3-hydroxymyristoyl) glucosamine N-acyltransferase [Synechococcus sp. PCC 7502]
MKLSELVTYIPDANFELADNHNDPEITGVAAIDSAQAGDITFLSSNKYLTKLSITQASAVIIDLQTPCALPCIRTKNPRLAFARVLNLFYQPIKLPSGIDPTVVLGAGVLIGANVAIAPHVVIGDGVIIGDDVSIFANTVIYPQVKIGDRSIIHANCVIREYTEIGQDCLVGASSAIGGDGFGFELDQQGQWYKIPQTGYVKLGDRVEIGSLTAIDRPVMGITDIGAGTKIDNLVQVGHGVKIGHNSMIVAQVGLAGGAVLGNYVTLAGQVGVGDQATIGDQAIVGAKSGVISHVEAGARVIGYPTVAEREWKRTIVAQHHLPQMVKTIQKLEKQVAELAAKLNQIEP